MKTRNQPKRHRKSTGEDDMIEKCGHDTKTNGTLANTSREGVNKFLKYGARSSRRSKRQNDDTCDNDSVNKVEVPATPTGPNTTTTGPSCDNESPQQVKSESDDLAADSYWEDGSNPNLTSDNDHLNQINKGITIEFDSSPATAKRKPVRRASAEEKEVAELVHRAHLLCLLGRGRLIDSACDDPLIQASLLSLLPANLVKLSTVTNLTVDALTPLVHWLNSHFRVRSSSSEILFRLGLASALETHEGAPEEIAALSVAMFRALNLSARFVSILDVVSLKPNVDESDDTLQGKKPRKGLFDSSTVMVTQPNESSSPSSKPSSIIDMANIALNNIKNASEASPKASRKRKVKKLDQITSQEMSNDRKMDVCEPGTSEGSKRKGDIEFEMQMEMALAATAATTSEHNIDNDAKSLNTLSDFSPFKKLKKVNCEESTGVSTAVGSKKIGAPLYWAEVYCNGENSTGKWVHIDAVNAIIDGEQRVEAAAAACKTFLRYVVAFAGQGAKDVTRRYCAKWYKIASHRVDSSWWDAVLRPLKDLESGATGGTSRLSDNSNASAVRDNNNTRNSLEDMELETKALTEPLPTNQQAYRSHHLYALERWLTKYQILHPKGPILGFCSGHPVYPRACVQMLHTKERWLREGLQLKVNELPVKVLKRSVKLNKGKSYGVDEDGENDCVGPGGDINLFGKWQTEPLCLPPAKNGIVPKNERGQVDVWSEKCLPPGTVHLGFPRIFAIAKKLEIDYAPAMVGFEFRNGRSFPLYNGIVVCTEFKDIILEAYAEEEERRGSEERRKHEAQALSRWYQLLSSIVTRQRLNNRYAEGIEHPSNIIPKTNDKVIHTSTSKESMSHQANDEACQQEVLLKPYEEEDHEHVFSTNDSTCDVESSIRIKRCHCGFSIEVEEL
ncbi:DNA repair protein RAD4 [Rutidosis leptorrhynchoides]|uniref:DNA repair protein RAD4 n=1 Tax=Rutidosis leptorrhynchoides TaxID=125765 RepID=UPI003A99E3C7